MITIRNYIRRYDYYEEPVEWWISYDDTFGRRWKERFLY